MNINPLFVETPSADEGNKQPTILIGKVELVDGKLHVRLNGSEETTPPTPATTAVSVNNGDDVLCTFENRKLTIIGNQSKPSLTEIQGIVSNLISGSNESVGIQVPGNANNIKAYVTDKEFAVTKGSNVLVMIQDGDSGIMVPVAFTSSVLMLGSLEVDGDVNFTSNLDVDGRLTASSLEVDGDVNFTSNLDASRLVIDEKLEVTKDASGNIVIHPPGRDDLSISFKEDRIDITGELYLNGEKVLTEEGGAIDA